MSEPAQCKNVLDVTEETLILAIKVAEKAFTEADLVKALQAPKVKDAIEEVLSEFAKKRINGLPLTVSEDDAKKLLSKAASKGGKAILAEVKSDLEKTPEWKRMEAAAKQFSDAISCRKGIAYDVEQGLVVIVVAGAILSGGVALYMARTGGEVTSALTGLAEDAKIKIFEIHGIKLSLGVPQLDTSERKISEKVTIQGQWKSIKTELAFKAEAKDEKLSFAGTGEVVFSYRPVELKIKGGLYDYRSLETARAELGLKLTLKQDRWDISAIADIKRPLTRSGVLTYGAGIEVEPAKKGFPFLRLGVEKGEDTHQVPLYSIGLGGRF